MNQIRSAQSHHLYSIYLGGAKILLKNLKFCKDCGFVIPKYLEKTHRLKYMTKKQSGNP